MKKFKTSAWLCILITGFSLSACSQNSNRLLIFSKTAGYRHQSIPVAREALMKLCQEKGIVADTTENAEVFTPENLEQYTAVIFLMTTGDVFEETQQDAFRKFIEQGGGYVGIHSASDTEYEWPWYGKLVGGYFESHPEQQQASVDVVIQDHPATAHLPGRWTRFDEWYNFKDLNPDVTVLATLDESTYKGGTNGDFHPISWYQEYEDGKAFYTAMGHTDESYRDTDFLQHLWGGIRYVIKDN